MEPIFVRWQTHYNPMTGFFKMEFRDVVTPDFGSLGDFRNLPSNLSFGYLP